MREDRATGRLRSRIGLTLLGVLWAWVALDMYVAAFFREESRGFRFNCPIVDPMHPPLFEGPVNSSGFRDPEHSYDKRPGQFRMLVLGDSFTYGAGVKMAESYPSQLEGILRGKYGDRIEVINAGVPGTGTAHHLAYYTAGGRRYSPDVVLLGYFDWNDAQDSANSGIYALEKGGLVRQDPPKLPLGYKTCFEFVNTTSPSNPISWPRRSRLVVFVLNRLESWLGFTRLFWHSKNDPAALRLTYALLGRFSAEARRNGTLFAVVRIPGHKWDAETQNLFEACREFSLPCLDLRPILDRAVETAGTPDAVFIPNDGHFTIEGNRIAAEAIADFLEERGLVQISK